MRVWNCSIIKLTIEWIISHCSKCSIKKCAKKCLMCTTSHEIMATTSAMMKVVWFFYAHTFKSIYFMYFAHNADSYHKTEIKSLKIETHEPQQNGWSCDRSKECIWVCSLRFYQIPSKYMCSYIKSIYALYKCVTIVLCLCEYYTLCTIWVGCLLASFRTIFHFKVKKKTKITE